jgi:hypothetical protein
MGNTVDRRIAPGGLWVGLGAVSPQRVPPETGCGHGEKQRRSYSSSRMKMFLK